MRSRPSLLLMRNLRSLAVVVLATLPCVAFAQWRVVAVSTEVDKMRFNTIIDAHSFMKNYRSGEEQGKGTPVGDALYPVASYGDGRYVSRICFKYLGATGDYDPIPALATQLRSTGAQPMFCRVRWIKHRSWTGISAYQQRPCV